MKQGRPSWQKGKGKRQSDSHIESEIVGKSLIYIWLVKKMKHNFSELTYKVWYRINYSLFFVNFYHQILQDSRAADQEARTVGEGEENPPVCERCGG